jgi:hypothetical protein
MKRKIRRESNTKKKPYEEKYALQTELHKLQLLMTRRFLHLLFACPQIFLPFSFIYHRLPVAK